MGVATVGLVLVLGRWWGLGNRGAALAALLVACDPILLSQSTQVMTESPATLLATAGLVVLTWASRRPSAFRALLAGATLALGAICRPTLLLWTIVVAAIIVLLTLRVRLWPQPGLTRSVRSTDSPVPTAPGRAVGTLRLLAAFLFGVLIVLSPWAIRNQIQFGRPIITTTHGGYTLLLANNPEFYHWLRWGQWGSVWRADQLNAWNQRKPQRRVGRRPPGIRRGLADHP